MKILITGSNGFIGKNLSLILKENHFEVFEYDINNSDDELIYFIKECDFIVHLAGVNRDIDINKIHNGNINIAKKMINLVSKYNKDVKIIVSSSVQASLDNAYGKAKKAVEDLFFASSLNVFIYRLSNVFGKWCRPNYNSVCATFCYNIAHDLPIEIHDENKIIHFNYIDDICYEFIDVIKSNKLPIKNNILKINKTYDCSLKNLADLIKNFKKDIESERHLPIICNDFELKLFITFCDYLNDNKYFLNYVKDERGYFKELYKSPLYGQISINMSYPNIIKGGHYHTYKKEIFYVAKGKCLISQKNIFNNNLIENIVQDKDKEMINILPNYEHTITNIGDTNSYTLMWISHIFNKDDSDTFKK